MEAMYQRTLPRMLREALQASTVLSATDAQKSGKENKMTFGIPSHKYKQFVAELRKRNVQFKTLRSEFRGVRRVKIQSRGLTQMKHALQAWGRTLPS
jgi:hypothetical protein